MLHRYIPLLVLLIIIAHGASAQGWSKLKGPHGGTVKDFEYDAANGMLYAIANNHLFVSASAGATWAEVQLPPTMFIEDLLIDGANLVGMLNSSQLMFSPDGGVTWNPRGVTQTPIRKLRKLPGAGMFVGLGEMGVQVTLDEGMTWKKILDIPNPGQDPNIDIAVATNGDVFVVNKPVGIRRHAFPADATNTDNWDAANWTIVVPAVDDYESISIVITPADKIFITHYSLAQSKTVIESSDDYGTSWQAVPMDGFTGDDVIVEPVWAIAPTGKIYLFDNSFLDPGLWEYTDGAPTPWVAKGWPTSPIPDQKVKCAKWTSNIQAFCGGGIDGVYRSSNTAASWSNVSTGITFGDGWGLVVMQSGRVLYLQGVSPGGYYYSDNAGTPSEFWTFQPFPYPIRQLIELPDNSVMMNAGGYIHTSADGLNWTSHTTTAYHFNDIVVVAANDIYGFGADGIRTSIDKGQTWTQVPTTGLPADMIIKATRDNDGYFYIYQPNLEIDEPDYWRLDSNVTPWQASVISTIPFSSPAAYHSAGDFFVSNNKVHLSSSGGTFFSTDKGATWQSFTFSGVLIPLTQGTGGVAISNPGNVAVTQDDGLTFTNYPLPNPDGWIREIAMDGAGDFFAAATSSPAMKFTDDLVLAPEDQPVYIDFDWQPLTGGPYGGDIGRIVKNSGGELFAISGTSLFKYNTALARWEQLQVAQVRSLFIDASDKIFVLTNTSLYTSTDDGMSFTKVNDISGFGYELVKNAAGSLVIATQNGLYRSVDDGANLQTVQAGAHYKLAVSANGTMLAFSASGSVLRSENDGTTWSDSDAGIVLQPGHPVLSMTALSGNKFALVIPTDVYLSADNGVTWTSISGNLNLSGNIHYQTTVSETPANELLLSGTSELYISGDLGVTWTKLSDEGSLGALLWAGADVYASHFDGVRHSADNGVTFTDLSTGITNLLLSNVMVVNGTLFAVANGAKLMRSSDAGSSWVTVNINDGAMIRGMIRNAAGELIAYGAGIYKSPDGGMTWTSVTPAGNFILMSTADGNSFYSYDHAQEQIIFSSDLVTWTPVPASGALFTNTIAMANDHNGIVYLVTGHGTSGHQVAFGVSKKLDFLEAPKSVTWAGGKIYFYDANKGIYETQDGATWVKKSAPRGAKMIISALNYFFIPESNMEGAVQVGGGGGGGAQTGPLWLSRDQGVSWQNVGDPGFVTGVVDVTVDETSGLAYGSVHNKPLHKSSAIVIPDDGTKPVHTALQPVDDATGVALNTVLSFSFDEGVVPVAGKKVRLFIKGSPTIIEEFDVTEAEQFERIFSFALTSPLLYSTEYYVSIDDGAYTDLFGNAFNGITTTTAWTFATKASPVVDSTEPLHNTGGSLLNAPLKITFSEPMTGVAGKNLNLYLVGSEALPVYTIPVSQGVVDGNTITFNLPGLLDFQSQYSVQCDPNAFVSADGGFLSVFTTNNSWLFETRFAPSITATAPIHNAISVELTRTSFQITLTEQLTTASGKNISIYAVSDPGTPVATSPVDAGVVSGNVITFNLAGMFEFEREYFVMMEPDALVSHEGRTISLLTANTNWRFITRNRPIVSSTTPADNATNVPVETTSFVITFGEPMTGATGKNISLYKKLNSLTPAWTIAADAGVVTGAQSLTYAFTGLLDFETEYFITCEDGAFRTAAGEITSLLTIPEDWSFTTEEAPDAEPPVIAAFTTVDKSAGIPLTISIHATDNKGLAVDKAKFFYRALNSTAPHTELPMTNVGTGTAVKFDREISDALYGDAGGIEFYFQVEDLAGFTERSPVDDSYYYSYLTSLSGASAPLLSGLPGGGSVTGYRIISIPYELDDNKVATIFNELGTQDANTWRLLTYGGNEPATWLEFPADFTTVERGKGYWINVKNTVQLSLEGASNPKNNQTSFFTMQLKSGWNQIGNPYPTPISWEETRLQDENIGRLKIYKGGATYENGDELKKFEGGFVYLNGPDLNVKVRFKGITSGGRDKDDEPGTDISGKRWFVPITLAQGEYINSLSGIGMHPDAREGYDRYDDFNAPSVFGNFELNFTNTGRQLAVDFIPLADAHSWEFNVKTNLGGHATLHWNNTVFGDNDMELYLFDVARQQALNMRDHDTYPFDPRASSCFRIYFGRNVMEQVRPDFVMLGDAYPNPSTGTTTIPFLLPAKSSFYGVTLEVFDLVGKKVATVSEGNYTPGFHEATWDAAADDTGNGIYLYRLVVNGDGGQQIQHKKIVLER